MVKQLLVLLVGLMFFASVGELQAAKLRWRLDLLGGRKTTLRTLGRKIVRVWNGYEKPWPEGETWEHHSLSAADGSGFLCRLMMFSGNLGFGVNLWKAIDHNHWIHGVFQTGGTSYTYDRKKWGCDNIWFSIVMHYIFYSKSLDYGDINLYGYFEGSGWNQHSDFVFWECDYCDKPFVLVYAHASSYYDIGICLSLNLSLGFLKLKGISGSVPIDFLKLGMIRMNYPYKSIPEPYAEHIPLNPTTYFYASLGFSLGYWNVR